MKNNDSGAPPSREYGAENCLTTAAHEIGVAQVFLDTPPVLFRCSLSERRALRRAESVLRSLLSQLRAKKDRSQRKFKL